VSRGHPADHTILAMYASEKEELNYLRVVKSINTHRNISLPFQLTAVCVADANVEIHSFLAMIADFPFWLGELADNGAEVPTNS